MKTKIKAHFILLVNIIATKTKLETSLVTMRLSFSSSTSFSLLLLKKKATSSMDQIHRYCQIMMTNINMTGELPEYPFDVTPIPPLNTYFLVEIINPCSTAVVLTMLSSANCFNSLLQCFMACSQPRCRKIVHLSRTSINFFLLTQAIVWD